ncbi:MAG: suppressor of fused domain protein [Crocinitomicaceae bacterium]
MGSLFVTIFETMIPEKIAASISPSTLVKTNEKFNFTIHHLTFDHSKIQLLITNGLREREQAVNVENKDLKRIELYFCLPDYFDLHHKSWPIDWLNRIAELPQKNNTWFGHGDTIPAGNPPTILDEKFHANHFILSRPIQLSQFIPMNETGLDECKLLAVIPLFQKELDFKMRNSHTILFKKLEKKGVSELVDTYRENSCRKRFLGLF